MKKSGYTHTEGAMHAKRCTDAKRRRGIVGFVGSCFGEIRQNRPVMLNLIQHLLMPMKNILAKEKPLTRIAKFTTFTKQFRPLPQGARGVCYVPSPREKEQVSCAKQTVTNLFPYFTSKKVAFTLAETLITLGLLGVVAALTLPSVIEKHQKQVTVSKLKKVYSELAQGIKLSEANCGTLETWDFKDFTTTYDRVKYFTDNYLVPNLKVLKACDKSNMRECWSETVYNLDGNTNMTPFSNQANGKYFSLVTESGYSMFYWLHSTGNGALFYIDLNGLKKPNTLGKDIFLFIVSWGDLGITSANDTCTKKKSGVVPYGLHCDTSVKRDNIKNGGAEVYTCLKNSGKMYNGGTCGALIMYDGWQIKDDYPW